MPKWEINLNCGHSSEMRSFDHGNQPFGFSKDNSVSEIEHVRKREMMENKLFEIATASKMQILMTMFMFWMIGNNISIFIMVPVIQSLISSVTGLLKYNKVFQPYENMVPSLVKYKLIYLAINFVLLAMVIYKMSTMGLIPVAAADYIDLIPLYETREALARS